MTDTSLISTTSATPTGRLLTGSLVVAPLLYLAADSMYAAKGWDSGNAGVVHVLGAIAYGFVLVRVATWATGWLQCATLFVGIVGTCGNVAYGFNTIHVSLGAVDLVDASGPAVLIKPLGLFCPLAFLLAGVVLLRIGTRVPAALVAVAGVLWPIAHIANVAWLAVTVNVLLVAGFVPLAVRREGAFSLDRPSAPDLTP
jgi:hypothetical protein